MINNIKKFMTINNVDRMKMSKDLKVKYSTLSDWINEKTYPRIDKIELMANYFHVTKADLIEEHLTASKDIKSSQSVDYGYERIPANKRPSALAYKELKGAIAAGMPLEMFEVPDIVQVPIDVDVAFPKAYFLIVKGDSMNKVISEGMYALIDPCEELNNGEIGVIRVNGTEATLKRFYRMGDYIMLQPESTNPEHKNQIYTTKEEIEMISILGKLVWAMTPIGMKF